MNYSGLYQGTYYPMGGFHEIILALTKLAQEKGVQIKYSSNVDKIDVVKSKVSELIVNGKKLTFDGVVAAADYHHVDQILLEENIEITLQIIGITEKWPHQVYSSM